MEQNLLPPGRGGLVGATGRISGGAGDLAEARGFEPPVPVSEYNDLANRRLKPLGHASVGESYKQGGIRDQAQLGHRALSVTIELPAAQDTTKKQAIPRPKSSAAVDCERGCGRGAERLWSAALTRPQRR
jgi:hypothetical protein